MGALGVFSNPHTSKYNILFIRTVVVLLLSAFFVSDMGGHRGIGVFAIPHHLVFTRQ